ncbi:MAG: diacylglyceryl transferase [Flavobacteriales bacterium]|jgi:prolipoprotein diacylglyceryltransferase|nr:MAG: diacylglyceryl transferase [Flavobacteriales bacterium]
MYPTIYHALLDLTGLDLPFLRFLNSFGFFVALAFVFASWTLGLELRRKEGLQLLQPVTRKITVGLPATPTELAWNGLLGFLLGWKGLYLLLNFGEASADPQGFLLSGKGSFLGGVVVGALLAWLKWREKDKAKLAEPRTEVIRMQAHEHGGNITMVAALWGLIGAKLFHWLENPDEFIGFIKHPGGDGVFSGLTMYGGLLVAGFMVIRYFRNNGIPVWHGADSAAPGVMLAYGVGRIGCQVSGDGDWGVVNLAPAPRWIPDWLWSYTYPNNVNGVGIPYTGQPCFEGYCTVLPEPVWPTPLYETIVCVGFFFLLWALRKRITTPGIIFFLFLLLNGIERFLIEKIRVNVAFAGTWTQAEVISLGLIIVGIAGIIWRRQRTATATNGSTDN